MATKAKRPVRMVACRFCGATCPASDASSWAHSHPGDCSHRQDRVPSLNGVRVGDYWRNVHGGGIARVIEIRLGGAGTYIDREPCVVTAHVYDPPGEANVGEQLALGADAAEPTLADLDAIALEDRMFVWEHPLWSLCEHYEPLSRPGYWPVPTQPSQRFRTGQEVPAEWRGPGYRHTDQADVEHAYWHSIHTVTGHSINWHLSNELWQVPA